jgi:hypothetical protein
MPNEKRRAIFESLIAKAMNGNFKGHEMSELSVIGILSTSRQSSVFGKRKKLRTRASEDRWMVAHVYDE